ncbi:hypothetical protein [Halobaculum lipolyticum]|uniref:Uncharacterized protein n=1 Tax=Halobaculum lipolyticum TaxID=3032001 RepID=A0ABD5W827_9EURY|nr:hypothetical protein [Halobaculum sp. DT31]
MSIGIEFGEKAAADRFREEYADHVCPIDDDRRMRTVHFVSDTPEHVLTYARAEADEGTAQREADGPGQAPLTDVEKRRIDFSTGRANVPWARSIKALAEHYGVSDWTAYLDSTLTVDEHRQVMEEAGREGGGARDDADQRDAERQASAAATELAEGCNHARGYCENGDPDACEYLTGACGYSEDEVSGLLAEPEPAADDGPTDTEASPLSPPEDLEGARVGAYLRSVRGYLNATDAATEHIEKLREALEHANDAARAVNGIRTDAGIDPIHFTKLEDANADLTDLVRMVASTCEECHADHSEHGHEVTAGDREDVRTAAVDGARSTPVGVSDETEQAASEADT